MSRSRTTAKGLASTTLFCAKCDAYIGAFKNEWRHVTTSYALPTRPGEHLEPTVEDKTRTVPNGTSQKAAEGCEMANVLCSTCSATIGQFCVKVQRRDQQYLLNCYLYKLTKVYLMDHKSKKEQDFNFIDGEPGKEPKSRTTQAISARAHSNGSQTPTLALQSNDMARMQPFLPHHLTAGSNSMSGVSSQFQDSSATGQDQQPPVEMFMVLSRQMYEHGAAINDNFNRIVTANGRITAESARISDLEAQTTGLDDRILNLSEPLRSQQNSVDAIRSDMKVNFTRYLQHEKAIQDLQATVEAQQRSIKQLTAELFAIRNYQSTQKEQKESPPVKPPPRLGPLSGLSPSSTNRVVQDLRRQREPESDKEESEVLGKRKRTMSSRLKSRKALRRPSDRAQDQLDGPASMPTPESTQEPLEPEQISSPQEPDTRERVEEMENSNIIPDDHEPSGIFGGSHDLDDNVDVSPSKEVHVIESDTPGSIRESPMQDKVNPIVDDADDSSSSKHGSSPKESLQQCPKRSAIRALPSRVPQGEALKSPAEAIDFSDDEGVAQVSCPVDTDTTKASSAEVHSDSQEVEDQSTDAATLHEVGGDDLDPRELGAEKTSQKVDLAMKGRQKDCLSCGRSGKLLCCESCSDCYHLGCLKAPVRPQILSSNNWTCPNCSEKPAGDCDIVEAKKLESSISNSTLRTRFRLAQEEMMRSGSSTTV